MKNNLFISLAALVLIALITASQTMALTATATNVGWVPPPIATASTNGNTGVNGWAAASLAAVNKKDSSMSTPSYSMFPPNIMPGSNYYLPDYGTDQNAADFKSATDALAQENVTVTVAPCDANGQPCGGTAEIDPVTKEGKITVAPVNPSVDLFSLSHEYEHHVLMRDDSPLNMTLYGIDTNEPLYDANGWAAHEPIAFLTSLAAAGSIIASAPRSDLPDLIQSMQNDQLVMENLQVAASNALTLTYNAFTQPGVRDQIINSENGLNATLQNSNNVGFTQSSIPNEIIVYQGDPITGKGDMISFICPGCDLTTPEGRAVMYDYFVTKVDNANTMLSQMTTTSPLVQSIKAQNDAAIAAAQNPATNWGQTCGYNCGLNSVLPVLANNVPVESTITTLADQSNTAVTTAVANNTTCTFNNQTLSQNQSVIAYSVTRVSTCDGSCSFPEYRQTRVCGPNGLSGGPQYQFSSCTTYRPKGFCP